MNSCLNGLSQFVDCVRLTGYGIKLTAPSEKIKNLKTSKQMVKQLN